jgi:hypothetical protein
MCGGGAMSRSPDSGAPTVVTRDEGKQGNRVWGDFSTGGSRGIRGSQDYDPGRRQ